MNENKKFSVGYNNTFWQNEPADWEETMSIISHYKDSSHSVLIAVSSESFEKLESIERNSSAPEKIREQMRESDERCAYLLEIPKLVEKGIVRAYIRFEAFDLLELTVCIEKGYHGDSDVFGVEPDTWIKAYLNLQGKFVSPFSLLNSKSNMNIKNLMIVEINPIDENGAIRKCPFNRVDKCLHLSGHYMVSIDENYGIANKNMNVVIPPIYKMIHDIDNDDGLIWVRLHDNLCGIIDLDNHFVIPPIYNYLSFNEENSYDAELNGKKGIIRLSDNMDSIFTESIC